MGGILVGNVGHTGTAKQHEMRVELEVSSVASWMVIDSWSVIEYQSVWPGGLFYLVIVVHLENTDVLKSEN